MFTQQHSQDGRDFRIIFGERKIDLSELRKGNICKRQNGTLSLKVHECRFENLPISSSSYENMSKISL